jgi:hypothetical protein
MGEQLTPPQVGRILDVAPSISSIPHAELHPHLNTFTVQNDTPSHFARVNLFQDQLLITDRSFPMYNFSKRDGWQQVVQLDKYKWIPCHLITGLSFVFTEQHLSSHSFDDCHAMHNLFVLKYCVNSDGIIVSDVPQDTCPPFASCINQFSKLWSVCYCKLVFNSTQQIRQEMQRILCWVAQSQGDFSMKNAKLQFPSCSWYYLKSTMESHGIRTISTIPYSQARSILSWGLAYESRSHFGFLDVLRIDTKEKLRAFHAMLGTTARYGVRKKRPKYNDGKALLSMNDVINVVLCPSQGDLASDDDSFQRFGVTDDGIDLAYDHSEGMLQIVIQYCKVVITCESL